MIKISLRDKFDLLEDQAKWNADVFDIFETKLNEAFPSGQFRFKKYTSPFNLDRGTPVGEPLVLVRKDTPFNYLSAETKCAEGF